MKQEQSQAKKNAIAAAQAAYEMAKSNAKNGLDRAIADAQAIRDQAIAAAGTNKQAIAAAKTSYKDSVKTIVNAFKTYMDNAKDTLAAALAAANSL